MPAKYKHNKISGPVKSFFEGVAGLFLVFTLIAVFGGGWDAAPQAFVTGVISAVSFGISSLIPSKNQFTQR